MKAKQYLQQIEQASDKKVEIGNVLIQMCKEVGDLAKARNAVKNEAVKAIYLEMENKWHALCRLINQKNWDFSAQFIGFRSCVKTINEELYTLIWGK